MSPSTPPHPALDRAYLADLRCALHGAVYPARPRQLAVHARAKRAPEAVVQALAALPDHPIVGPNQVCMILFGRYAQTEAGP